MRKLVLQKKNSLVNLVLDIRGRKSETCVFGICFFLFLSSHVSSAGFTQKAFINPEKVQVTRLQWRQHQIFL